MNGILYIVVSNGRVVEQFHANGAAEAHAQQTQDGQLFIRVGTPQPMSERELAAPNN